MKKNKTRVDTNPRSQQIKKLQEELAMYRSQHADALNAYAKAKNKMQKDAYHSKRCILSVKISNTKRKIINLEAGKPALGYSDGESSVEQYSHVPKKLNN